MMRVAHVTATFPPYWAGTGNVAYHNARLLHDRGHEVVVFTARLEDTPTARFPFRVEPLAAPLRLGNAPFTPSLVTELRGFNLIHLHYPYIFGAELALLAASRYGTPLVLTYHNRLLEEHPVKRALFGLYNATAEPLLMRCATKLLAVRKDHFVSTHPNFRRPLHLAELSNGVDTDAFVPHGKRWARASLGVPEDVPVALFVGALDQAHWFKNLHGLLEAFSQLSFWDARLLIVGDGDLRAAFEARAAHLGLASKVHFLGALPPNALPSIYSAADVTVLPSTGVESFGLVLVESLACATPVIASDLPGVRTLVDAGRDGWRVPPGDTAALAAALANVLGDAARARCMGLQGRAKVVTHFDWRVIGARLEGIYQEVLAA